MGLEGRSGRTGPIRAKGGMFVVTVARVGEDGRILGVVVREKKERTEGGDGGRAAVWERGGVY